MRPKPPSRTKPDAISLPPEISALFEQGDTQAADRLQVIGLSDGAQAKAARRALFLLKQRGIEPSASPIPPSPSPAVLPPKKEILGYLTTVSGNASQMCFFEETDPFGGAPTFHFFLANFASGLDDVTTQRVPRREVAALFERMKRNEGSLIVRAPADYVRHRIRQAEERLLEEGGRAPQGYAAALQRIGPAEATFDRPLIYESIDPDTLANDLSFSREPEPFFQSVYFRSWFLAMQAVVEWEEKYFEAVQSRFAVDQAQRESLGDKVVEEATDALLDPSSLRAMRRALEEQATVLHLAGHDMEARQALFQALSIDPDQPPRSNPFLLFYVKRSIFVVMAYKAEQEPEPEEDAVEPAQGPLIERG